VKRTKRSFGLWLVIIGFAVLSISGWQRLAASLASWYWLAQAGENPGPLYLALSGAWWGGVGLLAAGWLLLRGRAYRWVGLGAGLLLLLAFWLDRLLISRADGLGANLGFAIVTSLAGVGVTALVLRPWQK
jgi:hypothetical protein